MLKSYIVSEGKKLVNNDNVKDEELVRNIIEFRQKMVNLLQKSLDRDSNVDLTIKTSFENFINENEKTAKSLVSYLDEQFKKDFKNDTENEIAEKIDRIIQIFR